MKRLLAIVTAAALAVGLTLAGLAVGEREAPAAPAVTLARAHKGDASPAYTGRITFLVIGSDEGAPKYGRGGSMERGRADSIHLVVLDATKRAGIVIGFPRDSYVPIPGHGSNKINSAMAFGGPQLLVSTVERLTGIKVDYYAVTSFDGLERIIDRTGGWTVNVDMNVIDQVAGANLRKGQQKLNGPRALAYSRARKSLPGGDFTRSEHQGDVLLGGLATFQQQARRDPATPLRWIAAFRHEVKTDLPFQELVRLALFARQVSPARVRNTVAPGVGGTAGGASIVRLTPAAHALFARVRQGALS